MTPEQIKEMRDLKEVSFKALREICGDRDSDIVETCHKILDITFKSAYKNGDEELAKHFAYIGTFFSYGSFCYSCELAERENDGQC
jgi:hypothetical protein